MEPKTQSQPAGQEATAKKTVFALPYSVVGPSDVRRLVSELEALDNNLLQLGLRQAGSEVKMPKTSRLMDELVQLNHLNLLQAEDRLVLKNLLDAVLKKAPLLHVSFSADPSPVFVEKLMDWFRREVNPMVLVTIGLQPNIGAGCVLRTTNKYFDLSLRQDFIQKRELLKQALNTPAPVEAAS